MELSRTELSHSALAFAQYLTTRYPQAVQDELHYYFGGSLSTILLAQAASLSILDSQELPRIRPGHKIVIPPRMQDDLGEFIRQIGDLDYVETSACSREKARLPAYPSHPAELVFAAMEKGEELPEIPDREAKVEAYSKAREKFLWKGGGGPSYDDLPDDARAIFASAVSGHSVMCDPVSTYGVEQAPCEIEVDGRRFFVSDPRALFGYKALHILDKLSIDPAHAERMGIRTTKLIRDFDILYRAFSWMYAHDVLCSFAHKVLLSAGKGAVNPEQLKRAYDNPHFLPHTRYLFEEILRSRP